MRKTFISYVPGAESHSALYSGKRTFAALLGLLLIFSSCSPKYSETKPLEVQNEPVRLLILHTNDMHAQYVPREAFWVDAEEKPLIGGFGALDAYISREREVGLPTLLLDAGDLMTGTPLSNLEDNGVKGGALLKMMETMGYDIMALGNHEFDNGQENVSNYFDHVSFPIISANLHVEGDLIAPDAYKIIEIAGLRVGVIGLMTKHFYDVVLKSQITGIVCGNLVEITKPIVQEIDPITDLIILLIHAGEEEGKDLARNVPGIDIIVGGHRHARLVEPLIENGVLIVQAGSRTSDLGRLEVLVQADTVSEYNGRLLEVWVDSVTVDPDISEIIDGYSASILKMYGDTLATLVNNLVLSRRSESNVGSWVASIIKEVTESDFGIINSGGIRKGVSAGPLTKLNVIEMLPFNNTLATFEVSGVELLNLIRFNAEIGLRSGQEELQVSGISYKYRSNGENVELVEAMVGGTPIDPSATYKGGTLDFVLYSQPEYYFGFVPSIREDMKIILSDVVMDYAENQKVIDAKITGAIVRLGE